METKSGTRGVAREHIDSVGVLTADSPFRAELEARELLTADDKEAQADEIAAFVLGRDAPGGWKPPGLANSAPVVVRRVPRVLPTSDLSHMSPAAPQGPVAVSWTTEDPGLAAQYDAVLGETWARPAIGYPVGPGDDIGNPPRAFLVMGSGYATEGGSTSQGRTLLRVDALTGQVVVSALLPAISHPVYDEQFGALVDPVVGTHCLTRYWPEIQESYIADPAGRLFRWDLGRDTDHRADSGGPARAQYPGSGVRSHRIGAVRGLFGAHAASRIAGPGARLILLC